MTILKTKVIFQQAFFALPFVLESADFEDPTGIRDTVLLLTSTHDVKHHRFKRLDFCRWNFTVKECQFPTCLNQVMINICSKQILITHPRKSGKSRRIDSLNCFPLQFLSLLSVKDWGWSLTLSVSFIFFLRVIEAATPYQYVINKANVKSQEHHYHHFQLALEFSSIKHPKSMVSQPTWKHQKDIPSKPISLSTLPIEPPHL